jgi:hypothetical protein
MEKVIDHHLVRAELRFVLDHVHACLAEPDHFFPGGHEETGVDHPVHDKIPVDFLFVLFREKIVFHHHEERGLCILAHGAEMLPVRFKENGNVILENDVAAVARDDLFITGIAEKGQDIAVPDDGNVPVPFPRNDLHPVLFEEKSLGARQTVVNDGYVRVPEVSGLPDGSEPVLNQEITVFAVRRGNNQVFFHTP